MIGVKAALFFCIFMAFMMTGVLVSVRYSFPFIYGVFGGILVSYMLYSVYSWCLYFSTWLREQHDHE